MDADGSNQAVIYEEYFTARFGISWAPDGTSIVWAGTTWIPNNPSTMGVWRIDVNVVDGTPQGSNLQQLVTDAECDSWCNSAAWSPLGDEIIYVGGDDTSNNWWIYSIPANGGTPEIIYEGNEIDINLQSLTWSSDGTRIAFIGTEMSTSEKFIRIIERATGTVTHTLLKGMYDLFMIEWARGPDTLLIHASGPTMIYTMDIDHAIPTPIIEGKLPCWSPDNSEFVYMFTGRKGGIGIYDLSTGETNKIAKNGEWPDWRR
jgi:Tol biopolymer transport system component